MPNGAGSIEQMLKHLGRLQRSLRDKFDALRIAFFHARAGTVSRAPTESERLMTVTLGRLIEAGYPIKLESSNEKWIAREYPNESSEVKYAYEETEAAPGHMRFLLITRVERERSSERAAIVFREGIESYTKGAARVGARFVFKGNLQRWCENAFAGFTLSERTDAVVGCLLSFQKDRLVYSVLLRGIVIESEEEVEELVYPFLARALRWSGEGAGS
ncbi:MAG: hypothetical protein ACREUH_11290 [Burkholderiales bacterium]